MIQRVEDVGHSASPTVDRLLHIANTEERPILGFAVGATLRQRQQRFPLRNRCVLKLIEQQVEADIDGIVPVGTTGESPTLTVVSACVDGINVTIARIIEAIENLKIGEFINDPPILQAF